MTDDTAAIVEAISQQTLAIRDLIETVHEASKAFSSFVEVLASQDLDDSEEKPFDLSGKPIGLGS